MSKKLGRYHDEIERTEKKIKEYQTVLKNLRQALKEEEEAEMVRTIRGLKIQGRDLVEVLNGLREGTLTIQKDEANELSEETESEETGNEYLAPETMPDPETGSEREDKGYEG